MKIGFMKSKSVFVGSQRFVGSLGRWYNDQNIFYHTNNNTNNNNINNNSILNIKQILVYTRVVPK